MLSPGRLILAALAAACVYGLFVAAPPGPRGEGQYDAAVLAAREVEVWKAVRGREEFGVYLALVPMLREQHRYTWFRAAQASYYLSRAMTAFPGMRTRYERVLPDLEAAAAVERDWMGSTFDPAQVARAQLNWWVTRQMPNLNSVGQVAPLIAEEYSLRYRVASDAVMDAAFRRAEAADLADHGGADPDWRSITKLLTESHRAVQVALAARARRSVPD
jgi:hypothetical protein